jgi:L-aspartate oxidase
MFVQAASTVLATGGAAAVYSKHTNWTGAIGDGVVAAFEAGAEIRDMEFIQFHPTAVDFGRGKRRYFLISEAVRGEGAHVVDETGTRFLYDYDSRGELASRDEVARALASHVSKGHKVFLDCRPIGPQFAVRFPGIYSTCLDKGLDATTQLIPVGPVAHYMIGGITTTSDGQTTIPSLYACGEVASTGIHGANRLASNSLLECIVFGHRVARHIANIKEKTKRVPGKLMVPLIQDLPLQSRTVKASKQIKQLMYENVGIVRDVHGLEVALAKVESALEPFMSAGSPIWSIKAAEIRNQLIVSKLIIEAALSRKESRGTHFRSDYPQTNARLDHTHTLSV